MIKHYALSIDQFTDEVFSWLETHDDGPAGHYARYDAETKEQATDRLLYSLRPLVMQSLYESDEYGHPVEP